MKEKVVIRLLNQTSLPKLFPEGWGPARDTSSPLLPQLRWTPRPNYYGGGVPMHTPNYPYPPREKFDPKAAANYLGIAPLTLNKLSFSTTWPRLSPRRPPYLLLARRPGFLPQTGSKRSLRSVFRQEGEMNADRQGLFLGAGPVAGANATRPELHDLLPGLPRSFSVKTALYRPNDLMGWDRRPIGLAVRNVEFLSNKS